MATDKNKIFIFAPADATGDTHRKLEEAGCELVIGDASWATPQGNNEDEMVVMAQNADALTGTSIRSTPITKRIMESSGRLRIVAKYTIGVDDVDVEAATELGILVTHAPTETNWGGVAEGTMASMLCLMKNLRQRDVQVKGGGWREDHLQGTYVGARADGYQGITIGLIGLGRVGGRLAELLKPWRAQVIAYDPYIDASEFAAHGVKSVDYQTLLKKSDVVSLHVVLNKETHHMLGQAELSAMKPSAILINTSRGAAVDQEALIAALKSDTIAGAALDVFEDEPLSKNSDLRDLGEKVLLSPHMVSSNVGTGLGPGINWATESILKALKGDVPDNVYNKEVIPLWVERFPRNL